jgi:hypothetical protein
MLERSLLQWFLLWCDKKYYWATDVCQVGLYVLLSSDIPLPEVRCLVYEEIGGWITYRTFPCILPVSINGFLPSLQENFGVGHAKYLPRNVLTPPQSSRYICVSSSPNDRHLLQIKLCEMSEDWRSSKPGWTTCGPQVRYGPSENGLRPAWYCWQEVPNYLARMIH